MPSEQHICTMRDRIQRIEDRTGKLETSTVVIAEHLRNIDANVKAMKEAWIWTSRAVIKNDTGGSVEAKIEVGASDISLYLNENVGPDAFIAFTEIVID